MRKFKMFLIISISFFFSAQNTLSQINIQGYVTTQGTDQDPVKDALVELIDQADSNSVFSTITDVNGYFSIQINSTSINNLSGRKPESYQLLTNYPNPFNPSTVISWEIPYPGHIQIEIFNVLGQRIKTLYNDFQSGLTGRIVWDGTNDQGQGVAAGVYIYSMLAGDGNRINKKMLLLDGHTNVISRSLSHTGTIAYNQPDPLNNPQSNAFILRVSGPNLETYQENLVLLNNITVDISIYRTVSDVDGNIYRTIKIGDQCWMTKNLYVTHYRNGESISQITDSLDWINSTDGAFCYYNNDINNASVYGALYNVLAVLDSRNIAPEGWHVATDEEWKQLELYLGMSQEDVDTTGWRGSDEGGKLKETGTQYWEDPNIGATNETGFSARPNGQRASNDGHFLRINQLAYFWTSTENENFANWFWFRIIHNSAVQIYRELASKSAGFGVRCVKDCSLNTPPTAVLTVTPSSGDTDTNFSLDASGSTDKEDENSELEVRWDYYNDGTWDTNYSTIKTTTKKYSLIGDKTIKLIVRDSGGLTDSTTVQISVLKPVNTGTLTDIDGNTYNTKKIGDQWWMTENLRVTHYRNGDPIDYVIDGTVWDNLSTGAYTYYNQRTSLAKTYGVLYNGYAVIDSRKIAPEGWHVPTNADWKNLEIYLGMSEADANNTSWRGTDEGGKLKEAGTDHWNSPNTGATNESGFTALPAGFCHSGTIGMAFGGMGDLTYIWSSTEYNDDSLIYRLLAKEYATIERYRYHKKYGFSVRLVKNN